MNKHSQCQPALWPEPITAKLVELQAAGKSFGEIGLELGLSRNAVAGKCNRLGLTAVTVEQSIQVARHKAGIAIRDARLAALAKPVTLHRPKLARMGFKTKSELRSMLHEAMANTARMGASRAA